MNNKEILKYIDNLGIKSNIKAGVLKNNKGFIVYVMVSISENDNIGFKTFLEVQFKIEYSAIKLKDLINDKYKY